MERSRFETMLSEEQIAEMSLPLQSLLESRGFGILKELLQGSRVLAREQALDGPIEDINFWKGYIEGLRAAELLPQSVVSRMGEIDRAEDVRLEKKPAALGGYGSTTF